MVDSLHHYLITPQWSAPDNIRCCTTTRVGGISTGEYASFNMGLHCGDNDEAVEKNRCILKEIMSYKHIAWLEQVHGNIAVKADASQVLQADASWTDEKGVACVVMTADCLPVLFCDKKGQHVAAAHAGWRGLADGVLEATIKALPVPASDLLVWLGPAIGANVFEVGTEVRAAFLAHSQKAEKAFVPSMKENHFMADIYQLARLRLYEMGVKAIYGGDFCTLTDPQFFSYRRSAITGRMASLIYIERE